jgi:hypothetical protein
MSDILVNLFLTGINTMFPILHEGSFTRQYKEYLGRSLTNQEPSPFRAILFAVYACASNMLAVPRQNQEDTNGRDYFEVSLLDHYRNLGHGGLEEIQCLTILATCAASWNRLTEGWRLAGQAVRAAQDLGLHINFAGSEQDQSRSRVWWCVYTLNSCLSTCLGRPTGILDSEYDCRLPEIAEDIPKNPSTKSPLGEGLAISESPPIAGFVALAQGCCILDTISYSAKDRLRDAQGHDLEHYWIGDNQAAMLETQLSEWVREKIPSWVKFAANEPEKHGGVDLAMCTLTFMLHAIAVINLNL